MKTLIIYADTLHMTKEIKQCCVRLPDHLHRKAKTFAYSQGTTLQAWIERLIQKELIKNSDIQFKVVEVENPDSEL